jgi:predicted TIM-barrel fold metal-dependent hydrolase
MFSHAIFTPGYDGWMDEVDRDIELLKPDSFKGYTIGDNTNKDLARHPWRMDDEKLLYPFYEKLVKAGHRQRLRAQGAVPPSVTQRFPHLLKYADVRDVGKAAKDWPQLNFIVYHSGYRFDRRRPRARTPGRSSRSTGRIDWVTDLAEIPAKYGVSNVYADLGQIFAQTTVAEPRLCAP